MSKIVFKSFKAFRSFYAESTCAYECIYLNHVLHYSGVQKYIVMYLAADDKWHTDIYNTKLHYLTQKEFDTRAEQKQFLIDYISFD